ncbi:MAG: prolyl-tRNA synthetase associated domain-containing protein [Geminicoccaceae bacterium]|nr:prolyl-tRNA synthetase associated domain-containing protein [Geminicoccaceae bacterium]
MRTRSDLMAFLADMNMDVTVTDHPPVFTVDEAQLHTAHLPGGHVKNLFLVDKTGEYWLVTCLDGQPLKVNALARFLGAPRFSFAKEEPLFELLGVRPGSVTPLALINDVACRVRPVIDEKLLRHERVNVHPLENTATVTLSSGDLLRFMRSFGHEPLIVDLDRSLDA